MHVIVVHRAAPLKKVAINAYVNFTYISYRMDMYNLTIQLKFLLNSVWLDTESP